MSGLVLGAGGSSKPYTIKNSLMLDDGINTQLTRTVSNGDQQKWSYSIWAKPHLISTTYLFSWYSTASYYGYIRIETGGGLVFRSYENSIVTLERDTTGFFRDPSRFTHFLFVCDTTQAIATDRLKFYVDGERITVFDSETNPSQNFNNLIVNRAYNHGVGCRVGNNDYTDGYIAEAIFLDSITASPTDFGEFHPDCPNIWRPINPSGLDFTGTNSFWIDFKDDTSATTLGYDVSGNANHWTPTNIATTYQSTDTPTNNCCTLNLMDNLSSTLSEGSLSVTSTVSVDAQIRSTFALKEGKFYVEAEITGNQGSTLNGRFGLAATNLPIATAVGQHLDSYCNNVGVAAIYNNSSSSAYGVAESVGDVLMMAVDLDNGEIYFGSEGTWYNSSNPATNTSPAFSGLDSDLTYAVQAGTYRCDYTLRFHEDEFTYSPPTGFNALMSKYLPEPAIKNPKEYFDPVIYTGNGVSRTISTHCKVDHVIIKNRDKTDEWKVVDTVRGATKELNWNSTNQESTATNGVTSFGGTSGFNLGSGAGGYNDNGEDFVAYPFTKSSIAGMDIVLFTGTGANRTVSHSLGVAPDMMIVKKRTNDTQPWPVYHRENGTPYETLFLDTNAQSSYLATRWNATDPTTSVFSVGTHQDTNGNNDTYINYLFASVEGFSKFADYFGNGNVDGPFVHCGFKPAFVIVKRIASANAWVLSDIARTPFNPVNRTLNPDQTLVEGTTERYQFFSNGFKITTSTTALNSNAERFVYMAFAHHPFALMNNSEL